MRNTLLLTTFEDRFISENGIVAVPGDEDQLVTGDIRKINRPLKFERENIGLIRGNDANCREVAYSGSSALEFIDPF